MGFRAVDNLGVVSFDGYEHIELMRFEIPGN